jgi:hypothetical protein
MENGITDVGFNMEEAEGVHQNSTLNQGGIEEMIFAKDWFLRGVYSYKGSLTNRHLAKMWDMPHRDLNLFRLGRL